MRTLFLLSFLLSLVSTSILAQQSDPQLAAQMNGQMAKRNTAVFEENKGQMKDQHWQPRPDVLFNGSAQGMHYYIRDNGMSYQLNRVESWKDEEDDRFDMPGKEKRQVPDQMATYRVDVEWTDFNPDFTVEKGKELDGYNNYYNVPEGVEPALFVKQYESVMLKELWPGIDLRCYSTNGTLETDWLVAPGADYSQIRFEVKGAELSTDDEGHLIMSTPFGEIREGGLKVFQEGRQLEARWVITPTEGEVPGGKVSFKVMGHDPLLAMRIDPMVRVWGTYYGWSGYDEGHSCATDGSGNVYLAGTTDSNSSIASGGHQNTMGGGYDCFLVKFANNGERHWATYYGGNSWEEGGYCATDGSGNVYLAGTTPSATGIAFNGHQNTHGNPGSGADSYNDAFLVKFNGSGVRVWATYYGGNNAEEGRSCSIDAQGNVFLAGLTQSISSIASNGHQNTHGGGGGVNEEWDAFLVKFNDSGVRQWGTYYGGSGNELGFSCATDGSGNVYLAGNTYSASAIASGGHQSTHGGNQDAFLVKFNGNGGRLWGTYYGTGSDDQGRSCSTDGDGYVYLAGLTGSGSSIASNGHQNAFGGGQNDAFLVKFNNSGVRQWGTYYGGADPELGHNCTTDPNGNVYLIGATASSTAIASEGHQNAHGGGLWDTFIAKFSTNGIRQWGTYYGGENDEEAYSCSVDGNGSVHLAGLTQSSTAIASGGYQNTSGGNYEAFLVKFKQPTVVGSIWLDPNENCVQEVSELGVISGISLTIEPGNFVSQSEYNGNWYIDSLPAGTYIVSVDTTSPNWMLTCPATQSFTVVNPQELTEGPSFGFISTSPCPLPDISIVMPFMRRGVANQLIHVNACNEPLGTDILEDAYCIVELDEHLSVQSASLPYTELGDNQFRFDIGDLLPGQCANFTLSATVELSAEMNQTICLSAELYPQSECVFDTIPDPFPPTATPCNGTWDGSSLMVEVLCALDSVHFTVGNTGEDMTCFAPIRVYANGNQVILDSLMLAGGDSTVFSYLGNGQTWRLEADQHPYHPGNSNPSAHMEVCGSSGFQPFIVTMFPQDDADPIIDIFCDEVSAPYDPNDKTGSPRGLGETHAIEQNQQIEYLVRFQNIGSDTAVNVVILDTLSTDLNIFTVQSGVSSHPYEFRMYGARVLEWRFNNIMLPDSTTDEPGSHGFVMFKVQQVSDLPFGTVIENTANIYFDFEEPVITNTYFHTVTDLDYQLVGGIDATNSGRTIPSFSVFPNPSNSIFNLVMKDALGEVGIIVTDNMGREVLMEHFSTTGNSARTIDMSGKASGIYFLRVQTENGAGVVKLVKE